MNLFPYLQLLVPIKSSGKSARFRLFLRMREFFRKRGMWNCADFVKGYLYSHYGCEISIHAKISVKSQFMHTVGVVIGEGCIIEEGVIIYSCVCLGRKDINHDGYPVIHKNAVLCTGSIVLGSVIVGENCIIGANSLVLANCQPNGTYVGSPAKRLR